MEISKITMKVYLLYYHLALPKVHDKDLIGLKPKNALILIYLSWYQGTMEFSIISETLLVKFIS